MSGMAREFGVHLRLPASTSRDVVEWIMRGDAADMGVVAGEMVSLYVFVPVVDDPDDPLGNTPKWCGTFAIS